MSTPRIDTHHHLWRYDPQEYDWIGPEHTVLRRDFLLPELAAALDAAGVAGCIAVQARQTWTETLWLLGLAQRFPRLRGVVGWAPLADPDLEDLLAPLLGPASRLVGLRHVVQGEADPEFLLGPAIRRGLDTAGRLGLTYDLLVRDHQLPQAIACVRQHPGMRFVLDHAAKPRLDLALRDGRQALAAWERDLRTLAREPHVACKFSGLATEAGPGWTPEVLRWAWDVVLDAFGPERVLYGSDWPVCLLAVGMDRWSAVAEDLRAASATSAWGDVARWYRLP